MQACPIGATESVAELRSFGQVEVQRLPYRGNFNYHQRFYCVKEDECLGFVFTAAITKRDVVVSDFANVSLIQASRDTLDVHELPFVPAKQIFRVFSIHYNAFCLIEEWGSLLS